MSEIDERLDRGVEIFRRAGDDSALLGAALLTFHGALEQYIDAELRDRPELGAEERRLLEAGRLGWPTRAKLAEQAGLLSHEQARQAIEATRARIAIARGDVCAWPASAVESYGHMVATRCGRRELIRWIDQRPERAKKTAASPIPPVWEPAERGRFPIVRVAVTLLFLVTLVAVGWTLYTRLDGPRLLRSLGALPAPTAATAADRAGRRRARRRRHRQPAQRVSPGWAAGQAGCTPPHRSTARTRAIRLADGMAVTLRDEQQTDSSGTRWRLVEVGGYEGWCPENNLVFD